MMSIVARAMTSFCAIVAAAAALAHHGVSTYRMDVVETLEGVVARWEFASPHTWLTLHAADAAWEIEGAPPRWMTGQGFSPQSLEAGESVVVTYHPHRTREQAGILMEVRRADGTVLKVNRPASLGGP
jgi:hypothetical protein